jgi:hypothetical protein
MATKNQLLLLCSTLIVCESMHASEAASKSPKAGEAHVAATSKPGDSNAIGSGAVQQPVQNIDSGAATAATPLAAIEPAAAVTLAPAAKDGVGSGAGPSGGGADSLTAQSSAGKALTSAAATNAPANVARSGFKYGVKKHGLIWGFGKKAAADILLADLSAIPDGQVALPNDSLENDSLINTAVSDTVAGWLDKKVEGELSAKEQADIKKMIELQSKCSGKKMHMGAVARRKGRAYFQKHLGHQLALMEKEIETRAILIQKLKAAYGESFNEDLGSKTDDESSDTETYDTPAKVLGKTKFADKNAIKISAAADRALKTTADAHALVSGKAIDGNITAAAK